MAENKSNKLLKFGVPIAIFGFIAIAVFVAKKAKQEDISATPDGSIVFDLTDEERRDLNLKDGDTPHDTLKTLLSEVKKAKTEMEKTRRENAMLKRNQGDPLEINTRINEAVQERQRELEASFQSRLNSMQQKLESMMASKLDSNASENIHKSNNSELPIGLGREGKNISPVMNDTNSVGLDGVHWVNPDDLQYKDQSGKVVEANTTGAVPFFPNLFKKLDESIVGKAADEVTRGKQIAQDKAKATPYYTIPANATLVGAVALTALIGRIPLGGSLTDPFPFKAMIGRENLLANGIELPDVQEAVISGTVSGDWTLSCVRGKVTSMTFIFQDGRIVSLPNNQKNGTVKQDSDNEGIGWLSDPQGVTCIPGERKTNAPEYLSTQFLLSGASAAAQSLAQGQTTTVVEGGSVVGAVTGQQGKYILGQGLAGGLNETATWIRERFGQMFDAIYVPPGKTIGIHITKELAIDYDEAARKVKYHNASNRKHLD
ncbi:TIGR03752 family integrating conjugative element protein [Rodentibacter haemolyticus]|uniref:TIGR03752 family integrating conjugative element protein n=1 Tax=Rodentibacter haemolyticus TaxID=2778911 RepID=A0ABX6V3J2_9PAST|nr:TIGR03752 family integrating conjugative element protein [Rodentibacter haemolyticus]QPB42846.1 TIGR03752 family integrating conjugative element protein [Rodentibacter haemolyticus]